MSSECRTAKISVYWRKSGRWDSRTTTQQCWVVYFHSAVFWVLYPPRSVILETYLIRPKMVAFLGHLPCGSADFCFSERFLQAFAHIRWIHAQTLLVLCAAPKLFKQLCKAIRAVSLPRLTKWKYKSSGLECVFSACEERCTNVCFGTQNRGETA